MVMAEEATKEATEGITAMADRARECSFTVYIAGPVDLYPNRYGPPPGAPPGPPQMNNYQSQSYGPPPGNPHMPPAQMQSQNFQGPGNRDGQFSFQYSQCTGKKKALCVCLISFTHALFVDELISRSVSTMLAKMRS